MKSPRRAALDILREWSKGHAYAENLIDREATRLGLSSADRGLLNAIVLGVLRNLRLLDHWIGRLRDGRLDEETRELLRIGLCQLLVLDLPAHAAVNETVDLGRRSNRGLINAVLRRAAGMADELRDLSNVAPAVAHSHPDWLYQRWAAAFGEAEAVALMGFNNCPAPTIACWNPLGVVPDPAPEPGLPPGYFRIDGAIPPDLLSSGAIYIQDPATRHCVELLDPRPGERVLDACAAPGGKAFLIAAAQGGGRDLICTDLNEKRLPRLRENLRRLHIEGAMVSRHDWSQPAPAEWHGTFDAILLDVPCSNTGVFRRRVDVRWRLSPEDLTGLVELQRRIVENALPCLKPGGRLVYSTCSVEAEENERLVEAVAAAHPDLCLREIRQALPQRDGSDGAFAALLVKQDLAEAAEN
jgi:16S rRNA (cytosine967-C5)-methyltransferase